MKSLRKLPNKNRHNNYEIVFVADDSSSDSFFCHRLLLFFLDENHQHFVMFSRLRFMKTYTSTRSGVTCYLITSNYDNEGEN